MKKKLLTILTLMLALPMIGYAASTTTKELSMSKRSNVSNNGAVETFQNNGVLTLTGYTTSSYASNINEVHIYKITTEETIPFGFTWTIQGDGYGSEASTAVVGGNKEAVLYMSTGCCFTSKLLFKNSTGSQQSLTITSMTETVWNFDVVKSEVVYTNNSGSAVSSATIDKSAFSGAHVGDVIDFEMTRKGSGAKFTVTYGDASTSALLPELALPATSNRYLPITSEDMLAMLKTYGVIITGKNVVPASITIIQTEKSELDTAESDGTLLQLNAGGSWSAQKGSISWSNNDTSTSYTSGVVTFNHNSFNGKWNGLRGSNWVASLTDGEIHRFTLKLNEGAPAGFKIYIAPDFYGDFRQSDAYVAQSIAEGATSITVETDKTNYAWVAIVNEGTSGNKLNIAYFARQTVTSGPTINAPTITPVSGNYTGNVSVTITKGEGNDKVVYSISGAASGNVTDAEFTAAELNAGSKTIDLTGTADITVTATGYVGAEASTAVTNTYTFVVNAPTVSPASGTYDGDLSVTITPGEGNDKVVYTISGSNEDATDVEITSATVLNLTGTGTITVTATGYKGAVASTVVTNTYTYDSNIPSGVISIWTGNQTFSDDWGQNVQINNSLFANLEVGDYIYLNVSTPHDAVPNIGFRDNWSDGTFKTYTETSGGNAAYGNMTADEPYWWLKITDETLLNLFKTGTPRIQGQNFTLTSVEIHKAKTISETADNSITKYTDMIVNLNRTFVKDTWNTVCLPFVPTAEQANALFGEGYKLAAFTGASGSTMEFSTISISSFEAGKPYLVKPTADLNDAVTLYDLDLTATNGKTVTFGDYSFKGTFVTKSFDESDWSSIRFVGSGNKLLTPNDNSSMKALRCYFEVPVASAARSFTIDGMDDDSTTSITNMNREAVTTNDIYDLSGRQVVNPAKGLYIVNGHKVVIK